MMKFRSVLDRYEAVELSQLEAAELLGIGERTFRRWRQRHEEDGEQGLLDRRLGKPSGKRVPADREAEVEALYRGRYSGFTAKHFHEHLVRDHSFAWGYTWTKTFLHSKGLLERAKRRGAHRRKRPRRPLPGMMLHQDGSRHVWLAGHPALDLIVTMDDATGAIYSAFLVEEEGTASTFRGLAEVFGRHGLPLSLYTDRGSHAFLRDVYIPTYNARFAVTAEQEGSAFVAVSGIELGEILCVQEERQVGNDNCVSFNRLKLQIPVSPLPAHFVKATVKVRQYVDGTHAIFHGPRCIGRYDRQGGVEARQAA